MDIVLVSAEWDEEDSTEEEAYNQLKFYNIKNYNVCYLAFPWATFIKKRNANLNTDVFEQDLEEFKKYVENKNYPYIITTCQIAAYEEIFSLAEKIGITDIFCSKLCSKTKVKGKLNIFPFPTYRTAKKENSKSFFYTVISNFKNRHDASNEMYAKTDLNSRTLKKYPAREKDSLIGNSKYTVISYSTGTHIDEIWKAISFDSIPVLSSDYIAPRHSEHFCKFAIILTSENKNLDEIDSILKSISESDYVNKLGNLRSYKYQYLHENLINDIVELVLSIEPPNSRGLEKIDSVLFSTMTKYIDNELSEDELMNSINSLKNQTINDKSKLSILENIFKEIKKTNNRMKMFKLYLYGKYRKRIPFSYASYSNILHGKFSLVSEVEKADFLVVSNYKDIENNEEFIGITLRNNPELKIVLFSEEPFWDSLSEINSDDSYHKIKSGRLCGNKIFIINHKNCSVYDFAKIPYFITTEVSYITRYTIFYSRLLHLSPKELLKEWNSRKYQYGSLAEKRLGTHFDLYDNENKLIGLSRLRSLIAKDYYGEKLVNGLGWSPTPKRQKLPDWHIDKLANYFNKAKYLSAIENTHLASYITEKLFDAFAVRSFPVYYASQDHHINKIISTESYLNVYGLDSSQAIESIDQKVLSLSNAESYLEDANKMLKIFKDGNNLNEERYFFIEKVYNEFKKIHYKL